MPRRNHPSPKRRPQHGRGLKRAQGAHKKAKSEGLAKAIRDLHTTEWWTKDAA